MMRSPRSLLVVATVGLAALLDVGCGQEPPVIPVRNLERPSDMAFVCLEVGTNAAGDSVVTGRPMTACHPTPREVRPESHIVNVEVEPRRRGTFGLVTNTARGEVAVVDLDGARLVDLDPVVFGFNMLPVGKMPEVIDVSTDGCQAVTVNRASCDFSLIDPVRLLAPQLTPGTPSTGAGATVMSFVPAAGDQPLPVAPYEAAFVPQPLRSVGTCQASTASGGAVRRIVATFPACDLVALLEVPASPGAGTAASDGRSVARARVIDSVRITRGGVQRLGTNPSCPVECGVAGAAPNADAGSGLPDAAPSGDGGPAPAPWAPGGAIRVGPMAIVPGGRYVYVGALEAPFVAVLELVGDELRVPVQPLIPLHEGAFGTTRLRLSVDPFDADVDQTTLGQFVGKRGKFIYAFARDASVRVIDISDRLVVAGASTETGPVDQARERECDVNVDEASLKDSAAEITRSCFPVQVVASGQGVSRRALAEGPGLRVPVDSVDAPSPVPRDIAFAKIEEDSLGYLLSSNGQVYLIHLDSSGELLLTHSFRDANRVGPAVLRRGPPTTSRPQRIVMVSDLPFATRVTFPSALLGPRLESFQADPGNTAVSSWAHFPSPNLVTQQSWGIVWEDALPGTERTGGKLVASSAPAAAGVVGRVEDLGATYCRGGVEVGDMLSVVGCQRDSDCNNSNAQSRSELGTKAGTQVCYQISPGVPGVCFSRDRANAEASARSCTRFLASQRRYEIREATSTVLTLGLRLDEVPKTTLNTCEKDEDCRPTPAHAPNTAIAGDVGFACRVVFAGQAKRCVEICGARGEEPSDASDRRCRQGHVCEDVGSDLGRLCVTAPPPDPACWPEGTRTRVNAGHSYLVSGSNLPRLPTVRADPQTGRCVPEVGRNPVLVNRIPLSAPACRPMTDTPNNPPTFGTMPEGVLNQAGAPGPSPGVMALGNPCLYKARNFDENASTEPGKEPVHVKAYFQNPELRFVVTNLEQYTGDANTVVFNVLSGFVPDLVNTRTGDAFVSLGVRMLTSPSRTRQSSTAAVFFPHIMVIDQGRTFSQGSRGQVLRIQPRTAAHPSGRYDSRLWDSLFPIQ